AQAETELLLNQGRALRDLVVTGLPAIATAFKQSFGTIHYTHLGNGQGEAGPLNLVSSALGQVLAVARSFRLDPSRLQATPPVPQPESVAEPPKDPAKGG